MAPGSEEDDIFFPGRGRSDLRKAAREICNSCAVQDECGTYSILSGSQYGIWAGKSASRKDKQ